MDRVRAIGLEPRGGRPLWVRARVRVRDRVRVRVRDRVRVRVRDRVRARVRVRGRVRPPSSRATTR